MEKGIIHWLALALVLSFAVAEAKNTEKPRVMARSPIETGRYLVVIGSCNDCHTPGWDEKPGQIPESEWLTGSSFGTMGPWGTSYATNLRLSVFMLKKETWIKRSRSSTLLPTMPWYSLAQMADEDLGAIYDFIKSLGKKGEKAPDALPPGVQPPKPYYQVVMPEMPPGAAETPPAKP